MKGAVTRIWVGSPDSPRRDRDAIPFLIAFEEGMGDQEIQVRAANDCRVHVISARWKCIGDDFGQQLLNRALVQLLLKVRPERLVVDLLCGATLDFLRVGSLFGLEVEHSGLGAEVLPRDGSRAKQWLDSALREVSAATDTGNPAVRTGAAPFGYEAYAFGQRDHGLLYRMQAPLVSHFAGCRRVLDIGCGTGLFLEALARAGITPLGVERNLFSADYARGLGHEVVAQRAFEFLQETAEQFDGVYCSHFVEHLPTAGVERLMELVAHVLNPNGVALFVFPDPESIRSQLLGFWRDPEHVRFYHPDLIELIGSLNGLTCEFHSQKVPGRRIVSFSMEPSLPARTRDSASDTTAPERAGPWSKILNRLGLATVRQMRQMAAVADRLAEQVRDLEQAMAEHDGAISRLWEVNQTWAWDDNAVLRLRKGSPG